MGDMNRIIELKTEIIESRPINDNVSIAYVNIAHSGLNDKDMIIPKHVLDEMANSLPGIPVVGLYDADKEDFKGHGQRITIDDDGVREDILTAPYGFVPEIPKVWYEELDTKYGKQDYLCTEIILWTKRYPELFSVLEGGNGQSMEIEIEKFHEDNEGRMVVDKASFIGLCILGKDVTPAFRESSIVNHAKNDKEFLEFKRNFSLNDNGMTGMVWTEGKPNKETSDKIDTLVSNFSNELMDKDICRTYFFEEKEGEIVLTEKKENFAKKKETVEVEVELQNEPVEEEAVEVEDKKTEETKTEKVEEEETDKETETETAKEKEADDKADDGEGSPKEVGSKKSTKKATAKKEETKEVEVEKETNEESDKDSDWYADPANWSKEDLLSKMVELSAKVKELEELNSELFSYKETVDQMNLDKQIKEEVEKISSVVPYDVAMSLYDNATLENFTAVRADANAEVIKLLAQQPKAPKDDSEIQVANTKGSNDIYIGYK